MGPSRIYRNYTAEDGSFDISYDARTQRNSSTKKLQNSNGSAVLPPTLNSYRSSNKELTGELESITDEEDVTVHEREASESESGFHDSRVVFRPVDSGTALPMLPEDLKTQQRTPTSRESNAQERVHTLDGRPSTSSTAKATHRPIYRSSHEREPTQQQQAPVASPDGAQDEITPTNNLPEFFSRAVFQVVLRNPAIAHQLLKFGQSRLCGEHMEFLARVNKYHLLLHEVSKAISGIFEDFFADEAPKYVNVPQSINEKVNKEIKSSVSTTLPKLESVFASAQTDVERLIYGDIYPPFVRHQMSVSAAKALGGDRGRYAGLGDCFVLTDPTKADNPIVFASDGFVKVTGHSRKEIIPRNCRFLQSPQTERVAVSRIKDAIDKREECVELLLNVKKNGEPFWNLLYVTPLFGQDGDLVFFLGGQINCSTTIHSTNDVLRILAQSNDVDEDSRTNSIAPKPSPGPSRNIRHPFGSNRRSNAQERAPGMENSLVDRLGNLPLTSQFREFYTAYSNVSLPQFAPFPCLDYSISTLIVQLQPQPLTSCQFIVINYSTYLIAFVSGGVVDLLFPIKAKTAYNTLAIGTDVFKFLGNHGSGSLNWEFKSSVKNALKMGQAVSLDLKLCAKPSMGLEKFLLHWTPLKDELGSVKWIVLTLGNERRA